MGFGKWIEIGFLCIKIAKNIDPACGSGSLLLKAEKVPGRHAMHNFCQKTNR